MHAVNAAQRIKQLSGICVQFASSMRSLVFCNVVCADQSRQICTNCVLL